MAGMGVADALVNPLHTGPVDVARIEAKLVGAPSYLTDLRAKSSSSTGGYWLDIVAP